MNELITVNGNNSIIEYRTVTPDLLQEFINYIDRSENTTRTYIINLRQFVEWLRLEGITHPRREDILSYREYLSTVKKCKPGTIAGYLRCVKQFFSWTGATGYYPNIAANIRTPKVDHTHHKKDALTAAEVRRIEESINTQAKEKTAAAVNALKDNAGRIQRSNEQGKRIYAMYLLAVTAGLRTIELHRANVKDFEKKGEQYFIYIWGKGHTEADQKKPLASEVAEAINDYLQSRADNPQGNSPLFVATGNRSNGKRISTTTISTMLKGAMQGAGFNSERLTAHSLRHTTGTTAQELTKDLHLTQRYMRHVNPATTEIYLHNNTEKQEALLAQDIYNHYHGQTGTETLTGLIEKMSPEQIKRLTSIAAAMIG